MSKTSKFVTFERHGIRWNYTYFPGNPSKGFPPVEEYEPADYDGLLITRVGRNVWRVDDNPIYEVNGGHPRKFNSVRNVVSEHAPLERFAKTITNRVKVAA